MNTYVTYERRSGDTVSGEIIVIHHTYTTFDKKEMDRFEEIIKRDIGSGVQYEFDIDKDMEISE